MTKYCPHCGCPLEKTTYGRDWCPVCFKIIEDDNTSSNPDDKSASSYIG